MNERSSDRFTLIPLDPIALASHSPVVDTSLGELVFETETGVNMTAIRQSEQWLMAPSDDVTDRSGDVLIGSGPPGGAADLMNRLSGENRLPPRFPQIDVEEVRQAAETLMRLKYIAELTVGLSYSAMLLDDAELAAEVVELERQSD